MPEDLEQGNREDDHVEREVAEHDWHCEPDRLAETLQEDRREHGEEQQRQRHWMVQPARNERVLDDVCRGVGG